METPPEPTATEVAPSRHLDCWSECAQLKTQFTQDEFTRLARFNARWRLAWHFQALVTPGYSDKVLDGYSACTKLFLAYTAHEQLASALNHRHHQFEIMDPALGEEIREHLKNQKGRLRERQTGKQLDAFNAFWAGANADDVRPMAYAFRNAFAHGVFTSSSLTKSGRAVIIRLAESVLEFDEREFVDWLNEHRPSS